MSVPVIRTVLKMVGKSADPIPSADGLLFKMLVELKQISSMQVGEYLKETSSTTLHRDDGTSKAGFKFGSFQAARTAELWT